MQAWAWVLVGMGFVDRYGSNFLLPPRHFYILPTDNKKIAIGGVGFWERSLGAYIAGAENAPLPIRLGGWVCGVFGPLTTLDSIDISHFESKIVDVRIKIRKES
jgi:hypothetical protein